MTKTVGNESRKRTALLMAVYTFLLALGAALPVAASYQSGLHAEEGDGQIECGGYAERVQADEAEDEQAGERPRRRSVRAEANETTTTAIPAARSCGTDLEPITAPHPPPRATATRSGPSSC